ncbi:uncharacterized protein LOC106647059 [Copidosoma floridanum]|uniref:uncharacterized protein LOC106647059 n=1 Tax=Copidosoma floridanum TaxID=29053 RepID=UPI0006C997EF|nr:uncharacterized protein LOC106647059 [Copidosoma floridanum]
MFHLGKSTVFQSFNIQKSVVRLCTIATDGLTEWSKLKTKYSEIEQTSTLKILKKCSTKEMNRYGISEDLTNSLKSSSSHTKFDTLDDYILSDLLKVDELDKICTAISAKKTKKKTNVVSPPIRKHKLNHLNTAVGLRIGINCISWCKLSVTGTHCNVENWQYRDITDVSLNASPIEVIDTALKISRDLPDAYAYVMEKEPFKSTAKLNATLVKLNMRKLQVMTAILTTLSMRTNEREKDSPACSLSDLVYTMKLHVPSRHFGVFFGHEAVSADQVIENLIYQRDCNLNNITCVNMGDEIQQYHASMDHCSKEELNRCLMLVLTFFDLAVLQNR